jgi:hypothetical protein
MISTAVVELPRKEKKRPSVYDFHITPAGPNLEISLMDCENRMDATGGEAAHDMGEIRPRIIRINELNILLMHVTDGQRYRRLKITHTHMHVQYTRQSHIRYNSIDISAI